MPWFYVVSGAYSEIASVSLYLVTTRYLYNITDDVVDVSMKQLSPSSLPTHGVTSRSARKVQRASLQFHSSLICIFIYDHGTLPVA